MLNFDPEDPVRYMCEDGTLINAEVVNDGQSGLLESKIVIRVKEVDTQDDGDVESATDSASNNILVVSPIRVFKMLTAPQKRSLWSGSTSPYACPVALATVPSEDPTELEQWLNQINQSFLAHTGVVQSVLTLRLLGHLHYQLVIQKKAQMLFNRAALKVQDIFCQTDCTSQQARKVVNLIENAVGRLTSGVASDDLQAIFPSKAIGEIIDNSKTGIPHVNFPQSSYLRLAGQPSGGSLLPTPSSSGLASSQVGGGSITSQGNQPIPLSSSSTTRQIGGGSGPPLGGVTQSGSASNRFPTHRLARSRRGYHNPRYHRFRPTQSSAPQQPPQPDTCMRSATAWLEQAKADFKAAELLLGSSAASTVVGVVDCKFPALVCFLCHDTVEKCIKGVYYAFCGLRQDLINCSNLVTLHEVLVSLPHHPGQLFDPIKECVMSINRHENRSRFPNYQNPPCSPASIYDIEDAKEAFLATTKFLRLLQSEEKFHEVLGDLGQLPARRFMSVLQSMPDNQGIVELPGTYYTWCYACFVLSKSSATLHN